MVIKYPTATLTDRVPVRSPVKTSSTDTATLTDRVPVCSPIKTSSTDTTYNKVHLWVENEYALDDTSTAALIDYQNDLNGLYSVTNSITCNYIEATTLDNAGVRVWYSAGDGTDQWTIKHGGFVVPSKTPLDRLREIIRQRQAPGVIVVESKRPLSLHVDIREQRARETLARLIGRDRFMRFLKQGFISAKNRKSGRVYQIFPGHGITRVFENGNLVARLCVVLQGNFPPTDSLIFRYLMALNDEDRLWNLSAKHGVQTTMTLPKIVDQRPLPEIFADLQKKVA